MTIEEKDKYLEILNKQLYYPLYLNVKNQKFTTESIVMKRLADATNKFEEFINTLYKNS